MTIIETAERKGFKRALGFLFYAALMMLLLMAGMADRRSYFLHGVWLGLTATALVIFLPLGRWLRPNNPVTRLMDDEGSREHRRLAMVAGFWAATCSSLALAVGSEFNPALSAAEVSRVIATAAAFATLTSFAMQELRAAR